MAKPNSTWPGMCSSYPILTAAAENKHIGSNKLLDTLLHTCTCIEKIKTEASIVRILKWFHDILCVILADLLVNPEL